MEYEKYETGSYKFISSKNKVVVYVVTRYGEFLKVIGF